ncbi:Ycf34 family protein [Romeria aff. gracilis LEGE 07310]|uniref:Ycf34 family protein n=1 Tax=Vasconcelosia minhoensis LEGE 07310 TaxID=915328 RepID=A0A8J7ALM1_9CYAN|nr:Ycf34 family protein [Romeria gracilis]MBE9076779.1 Ycf34 family protein [Romeria aff. gracilis LEGE 07310]
MCICVNCHYVDRCITYHAVEANHQQPHLTMSPSFEPDNPTVNANIMPPKARVEGDRIVQDGDFGFEYDVVGCNSFLKEQGKWAKLRPGEAIPT